MTTEQKKTKYPKPINTPKGVFSWPKLNVPDDKFNSENPVYSVKLILTPKPAEQLKKQLQPLFDAAVEAAREEFDDLEPAKRKKRNFTVNNYFEEQYDDEGEETGNLIFTFKMKSKYKDNKTGAIMSRKPNLFDSQPKPLDPSIEIWSGTQGKVSFTYGGYLMPSGACGLSLRLKSAQILDLVTKGSGGCDFGAEEGYEASAETDGFSNEAPEGNSNTSDEEDF